MRSRPPLRSRAFGATSTSIASPALSEPRRSTIRKIRGVHDDRHHERTPHEGLDEAAAQGAALDVELRYTIASSWRRACAASVTGTTNSRATSIRRSVCWTHPATLLSSTETAAGGGGSCSGLPVGRLKGRILLRRVISAPLRERPLVRRSAEAGRNTTSRIWRRDKHPRRTPARTPLHSPSSC